VLASVRANFHAAGIVGGASIGYGSQGLGRIAGDRSHATSSMAASLSARHPADHGGTGYQTHGATPLAGSRNALA
jgi:hypothetical protein